MKIKSKKFIEREKLKEWKNKVHERDNYKCLVCGNNLKNNLRNCHSHHILDKKNFKDFKFDVMNGLTLCYRCHKVGPNSPHMNAIYFSDWLKKEYPEFYYHTLHRVII